MYVECSWCVIKHKTGCKRLYKYNSHYTHMHTHTYRQGKMAEILHKIINSSYYLVIGFEVI